MKVRDELLEDFGERTAPPNNTYPAAVPRSIGLPSELPSLFAGEHSSGESNLPTQVSQSEILAQNEARGDNMWTGMEEAENDL